MVGYFKGVNNSLNWSSAPRCFLEGRKTWRLVGKHTDRKKKMLAGSEAGSETGGGVPSTLQEAVIPRRIQS